MRVNISLLLIAITKVVGMRRRSHFRSFIILSIFHIAALSCETTDLHEGDICGKDQNGQNDSICKRIDDCNTALQDISGGKQPTVCTYDGRVAIVCCRGSELNVTTTVRLQLQQEDSDNDTIHFPEDFPPSRNEKSKSQQICEIYASKYCIPRPKGDIKYAVGGTKAFSKQYQFMALVGYGQQPNIQLLCGGSLISHTFVLSAAHCAIVKNNKPVLIRLGELDFRSTVDDSTPMDYGISEIFVHPQYESPYYYHDIALFRLNRNVEFTDYIRPVCLNWMNNEQSYYPLTATGWGQTAVDEPISSHLLGVDLSYVPLESCRSSYGTDRKYQHGIDADTMLCAGEGSGGKDTCQGDSGGPLLVKNNSCLNNYYIQIGVTSFGRGCAEPNTPGIYTRISYYISWIDSIVWR